MGCQSEVYLGENLTFSITTHDPDTGVLTDADAVPAYRVYEDETAVAILTGNMAKLDDASTTGFYTELLACTTANGFEDRKSYTIYIEATVDGDKGGMAFSFRCVDFAAVTMAVADALLGRNIAGSSTGGRTVTSALRAIRNKTAIAAGTLTVYDETDAGVAWTAAVTTTAGNPISAVDPA